MGIKSRFLCLIVLLLGSILKVEAQEILTKEQLNDSTYTSRFDGVYVLVDKTYNTILSFYGGVFGYYDNDQKEGYWREVEEGRSEEGNYHKGQRTGIWKCDNYSEGRHWVGSYKRGLKDGVWVCTNGSGRVIVKEVFRMGVLESRVTFED